MVIGQSGRYLRIVYVEDRQPNSVFVVTAYELSGKPLTIPSATTKERQTMKKNEFPAGWDEERVQRYCP